MFTAENPIETYAMAVAKESTEETGTVFFKQIKYEVTKAAKALGATIEEVNTALYKASHVYPMEL